MDRLWYYARGDESVGPLSLGDLGAILSHVSDARGVLVWREGFTKWMKAGSVPELASYVIKPPPLPVSPPGRLETPLPLSPSTKYPLATPVVEGKATNLHAWRRYFARMFDLYVFSLVFFLLLGIIFPELFETMKTNTATYGSDYLYGMLAVAAYVIFETICLNLFGTTFGKRLYGIKIKMDDGNQIAFSTAFKRSLSVWIRGMGFGFPLISLITLIVGYSNLQKNGKTFWDRDFNCSILHGELSAFRWLVIAIVRVLFLSAYVGVIALGAR